MGVFVSMYVSGAMRERVCVHVYEGRYAGLKGEGVHNLCPCFCLQVV
jgi:hypothetical protein